MYVHTYPDILLHITLIWLPIATAVSLASPVIILTATPPDNKLVILFNTLGRGGSNIAMTPVNDKWFSSSPVAMAITKKKLGTTLEWLP